MEVPWSTCSSQGVVLSDRMRAFLDEVKPAIVGTTRHDGTVQMNPIWFDRDRDLLRLNATVSRRWGKRLDPGSSVTLLFIDRADMWRWAEIRGRVPSRDAGGRRGAHRRGGQPSMAGTWPDARWASRECRGCISAILVWSDDRR